VVVGSGVGCGAMEEEFFRLKCRENEDFVKWGLFYKVWQGYLGHLGTGEVVLGGGMHGGGV